MPHSVRVAGHDLPLIDWPEARKRGWSEEQYMAQYDYTKRLGEKLRKDRAESEAWRRKHEYEQDTCESCGSAEGLPHTAMFGGAGGEQVELSLCKKCQNEKGIWNAMLLRSPKKTSPAVREQVEIARANRFGYHYQPGGKRRHGGKKSSLSKQVTEVQNLLK